MASQAVWRDDDINAHLAAANVAQVKVIAHYHVTVTAIQKANGLKDPNVITVGQLLIIPAP